MKKTLLFFSFMVFCLGIVSCGGSASKSEQLPDASESISVDQVLADPDALVGDTIVIEGVCSHLCRHGGRKAFIAGSADSLMLRCEAFPLMGEPFPKSTVHHLIRVTGVLREQRIDEATVAEMVRENNERLERMADYRARIAERYEREGRHYLSFYYLDAISYETLPE